MDTTQPAARGIHWNNMEENQQLWERELELIPDGNQVQTGVSASLDAIKTLYYIRRLKEVTGCEKVILKWIYPPLPTHPRLEEYYNEVRGKLKKYSKPQAPQAPGTGIETKTY